MLGETVPGVLLRALVLAFLFVGIVAVALGVQ